MPGRSTILFALAAFLGCVPEERPKQAATTDSAAPAAQTRPTQPPQPRLAPTPSERAERPTGGSGLTAKQPVLAASLPLLTAPFRDEFERSSLGPHWKATNASWQLQRGELCASKAHNHPVWLLDRLPRSARVEFDATSHSPEGDLKVEVWGDGQSAATGTSYNDATGYLVIYGGWRNSYHVLARLDEHSPGRRELATSRDLQDFRARPVAQGHTYRFKIERSDGKTVRFWVDDIEILAFSDDDPLFGPGHEHLGFNNWETSVCFDNLVITPLKGS